MRFCIYLTRRGLITSQECLAVLSAMADGTPPFGRLAIRERVLSLQQVAALLHNVPDGRLPLGELAVRAGLMTEEQRNGLLELQRRETPRETDVLQTLGILDGTVVEREFNRFVGSM